MGFLAIAARLARPGPEARRASASATGSRASVGKRAFNILWKPLLEAKIGDAYPGIPALWLSSRMNREKNTRTEVKGCLVNGYGSLIDALERSLVERGVTIHLSRRVTAIEDVGGRMRVAYEDGSADTFDSVVSTSPARAVPEADRRPSTSRPGCATSSSTTRAS